MTYVRLKSFEKLPFGFEVCAAVSQEENQFQILRDFRSYSFQLIKLLLHFHSKTADVVLGTEYTGIGSTLFSRLW